MDARMRSACYPQRTFYPLSYGPSTRNHRITLAAFQLCSCCSTRSQARFYQCARRPIANRSERAFVLLRYSFGGDRPSQTARLALFPIRFHGIGVRRRMQTGWYFTLWLFSGRNPNVNASHLCYAVRSRHHYQVIVKVHALGWGIIHPCFVPSRAVAGIFPPSQDRATYQQSLRPAPSRCSGFRLFASACSRRACSPFPFGHEGPQTARNLAGYTRRMPP